MEILLALTNPVNHLIYKNNYFKGRVTPYI